MHVMLLPYVMRFSVSYLNDPIFKGARDGVVYVCEDRVVCPIGQMGV